MMNSSDYISCRALFWDDPDNSYSLWQTRLFVLQNYCAQMNTLSLLIFILTLATHANTDNTSRCHNQGICSSSNRCQCPPTYIGQTCQIYAQQLKQEPIETTLDANETYFYFLPTEANYYRLTFNICMLYNPSLLPSLFYIQTQKINGALGSVHSLFETAKIVLGEKGCVSFTTHYIGIKRKEDESFRKIVVTLAAMEKDDLSHYLNVYRSEAQNSDENLIKEPPTILLPAASNYQRVTIQMNYQKYMQTSSYANYVIVITASILLFVFSAFINYIRKKYRVQVQDRTAQFQQFDLSRYRYHSRHNPQMQSRRRKNKAECIEVFMPVTLYGEKSCFFVVETLSNCEEVLQTDAEDCCSICLNYFIKQEQIRTTPCKHQYHRQCIDNWCESNLSCPICRYPLDFKGQIKKIYVSMVRRQIVR